MPVNLSGSRPKTLTRDALPVTLIAEPPIENDTANQVRFRVSRQGIQPPVFTLPITTTNNSKTISGTDLSKLRGGDAIDSTKASGNVTAVNTGTTPHTATISAAATSGGATTATVTPPAVDAALYDVVVDHVMNANDATLYISLDLYRFDGLATSDSNLDGKDDVTTDAATKVGNSVQLNIDLDQFLSNARIPRT